MFKNNKSVAILMSTYNGEKFISEQIESIIAQSFVDWNLYIRDDGSLDETVNIIKKYERENENIFFINSEQDGNIGVISSFLFLLDSVQSDFYMFADQDDVWLKDKIKKVYKLHEYSTEPLLVYSNLKLVDSNLNSLGNNMIEANKLSKKIELRNLLTQNSVTGCTMFFNNSLKTELQKTSDFKDALMHDWWIALIAQTRGKIIFLDEPTILYRQHENNVVGSKSSISRIFKGYGLKEMTSAVLKTKEQAKAFYHVYKNDISSKDEILIKNYLELFEVNIFKKMKILKNNKYYKTGNIRNLFFYLIILFLITNNQ
ncbi:glycosyltransferase family 2 protein [Vagococcus fluvialis]|uniref:glycosyltransferase family 2 protein n=1 Tax=Vagococcus fluvialis TaxID=2738 RepID=UPI0037997A4C